MRKLLRNRKGVTLVEVLAVIVILGIIAAIAVPTIGNLIENQREKAAETEWANVLDAARIYATSEEPNEAFSLSDMSAYITLDSSFTDQAGTDLSAVALFDTSGSLVETPDATSGEFTIDSETYTGIFINEYLVVPAGAEIDYTPTA